MTFFCNYVQVQEVQKARPRDKLVPPLLEGHSARPENRLCRREREHNEGQRHTTQHDDGLVGDPLASHEVQASESESPKGDHEASVGDPLPTLKHEGCQW